MRNEKLMIRYHNPNTDEETLKLITKIFVEASRVKFETILRETAAESNINDTKKGNPQ